MNVIIHPNAPLSAACLIAWKVGGNLVTVPKKSGKGYISYIQEARNVSDHKAQKIIHEIHVYAAPTHLDAA